MIEQDEIPVPALGGWIAFSLLVLYWGLTSLTLRASYVPERVRLRLWPTSRVISFKLRLPKEPAWLWRSQERMVGGNFYTPWSY